MEHLCPYHGGMSHAELTVKVRSEYLPDQSAPTDDVFVFAYHITITNTGNATAQVVARTWNIHHANGQHDKVRGLGVVGHQPVLEPGAAFTYSSYSRLGTPTGMMQGRYTCLTEEGDMFYAEIPVFVLTAL